MWRKIIDDYRSYYLNDLFEIKLIFYSLSRMSQFSQFVCPLSYSVWDVFNNFLLIDATDRSKISSDQMRFFIALSLYPLSFFANTPFKCILSLFLVLVLVQPQEKTPFTSPTPASTVNSPFSWGAPASKVAGSMLDRLLQVSFSF